MRASFPVTLAIMNLLLLITPVADAADSGDARLLRQPAIHGQTVVFVYAGDLWTVSTEGGVARKLTSFTGDELFPVISPDGEWLAFSGEYSGTRQIYVMPVAGGQPRQLTFYPDVGPMPPRGGWDNIPVDWTPDGRKILFRSNRTPYGRRISRYFLVDAFTEGLAQPLQIPEGGPACLSPDGSKLAYSIKSREYRTWKRYRAGRAQDLWIYDLQQDTVRRLTTYPGTDSFPMWIGDTIYFISDRSAIGSDEPRTLNLFAYDLARDSIRQVTHFDRYDCLWPRRGKGGIVFENGGYLYLLDPSREQEVGAKPERLTVIVQDDRPHALPRFRNVAEHIDSAQLSPSGKRAIFSARGEIFTVPEKHGDIRNLSHSAGVRERAVGWSPDGAYLSYLSEAPGDYELFIRPYHGDGEPRQLTFDSVGWITGYRWSPDATKIVLTDTRNRLQLVEVASGDIALIDRGTYNSIGDVAWSADSRWIAYAKVGENRLSSIWVWSVQERQPKQLTSGRDSAFSPAFDPGGKYLSFVAQRDFDITSGTFDGVLLAGTLRADLLPLLEPQDDDEEEAEDETKPAAEENGSGNSGHGEEEAPAPLAIDLAGFESRVVAFPVESGPYRQLTPLVNGLLYLRNGTLYRFDLDERKESTLLDKVDELHLAAGGKKLLYRSGTTWGIASVNGGNSVATTRLELAQMTMKITPEVEWRQIYTDAWRIMRDWFYDPGMHGIDWQGMHDKYAELLPYVASRADLDYLLGELIGELNAGHTYVMPAKQTGQERIPVGVLGCELEPAGEFYQITKRYRGSSWSTQLRSPLDQSGVEVAEGDYLIAIDGKIIRTDCNPYRFLENKVGRRVTLLINDRPSAKGAREVVVHPVDSELQLRHLDWVERNRQIVDRLSQGRVGYLYVPDTAGDGHREFFRGWHDQWHKDALIIDDRYNGGGWSPHRMAFELAHPVLHYWARRDLQLTANPVFAHDGPKVMLINGLSSSGGDAFPDYFRRLGLGPLMGATTWGGLIGYGFSPSFVDGGGLAVPSLAYVNTEGEWDVESYGVTPDEEVFDDPTLIQAGREPMLERAVEYLLAELAKQPPNEVTTPPHPDRS